MAVGYLMQMQKAPTDCQHRNISSEWRLSSRREECGYVSDLFWFRDAGAARGSVQPWRLVDGGHLRHRARQAAQRTGASHLHDLNTALISILGSVGRECEPHLYPGHRLSSTGQQGVRQPGTGMHPIDIHPTSI